MKGNWELLIEISQDQYEFYDFTKYKELYIDLKYDNIETGCIIPTISLSIDPYSYIVNGQYCDSSYNSSFVIAISYNKVIIGIVYINNIKYTSEITGVIYGKK